MQKMAQSFLERKKDLRKSGFYGPPCRDFTRKKKFQERKVLTSDGRCAVSDNRKGGFGAPLRLRGENLGIAFKGAEEFP